MELPVELRLQIYGELLHASAKQTPRRSLPQLRRRLPSALGDGVIAVRKVGNRMPHLHSRSALPSLAFLRTCRQISSEALQEIYKFNAFEVVATTQHRPCQLIFELPGFLLLNKVRDLILVTHSEVSRFQSCFAYDTFQHMPSLRSLEVSMKTELLGDGPDFHSCLETLNLVCWVPKRVEVSFSDPTKLIHHDHPTWVSPKMLAAYFDMFKELRGSGHSTWNADIAMTYDKALQTARCFSIF